MAKSARKSSSGSSSGNATVDKLAKRMAVADRHVDRFRVLNGLGDKDRVKPGDLVKVVVE